MHWSSNFIMANLKEEKVKFAALILCLTVMACAPYKPPLEETQIVDGKSIVVPPEFKK